MGRAEYRRRPGDLTPGRRRRGRAGKGRRGVRWSTSEERLLRADVEHCWCGLFFEQYLWQAGGIQWL